MAKLWTGWPAILATLLSASTLQAGLYNTAEPDEGRLSPDFVGKFRFTLLALASIGAPKVEFDFPLRKRYVLQSDLAAQGVPPGLTPDEKLNLSAVFIRRGQAQKAVELLVPATRTDRGNFLLHSNLATAFQELGETAKAREQLRDALALWPKEWDKLKEPQRKYLTGIGWNEGPFGFYRRCEEYQLKLLRSRAREVKGQPFTAVDPLFDDGGTPPGPVRYVGASGKFVPGTIAPEEKEKLPPDALEIVQQLLVWLPADARLYWQLGELYNARGDLRAAKMIFEDLNKQYGLRVDEYWQRRQVLLETPAPDEGGVAFEKFSKQVEETPGAEPEEPGIQWRSLAVGFGAGAVVMLFAVWQVREIRRRRQKRLG